MGMSYMMSPPIARSWNMTPFDTELKTLACLARKQPSQGENPSYIDPMNYCFKSTLSYDSKLVWGELCCKIEAIKCELWVNTMFPPLQWDGLHLKVQS
jgi:hypothetical protein